MTDTKTERLAHRRPPYGSDDDDRIVIGIERALQLATRKALDTGRRQVVTVNPVANLWPGEGAVMRVQAWR